jgi:DNA-binding transcriptional MerR regulator
MTDERSVVPAAKSAAAFRTIGEVATELGIAQHVLRYWESRFPQLKPLQRAGNRRLYRPADVDLARRIHALLSTEGYSIRGVQKVLADGVATPPGDPAVPASRTDAIGDADRRLSELHMIRAMLASALADDVSPAD